MEQCGKSHARETNDGQRTKGNLELYGTLMGVLGLLLKCFPQQNETMTAYFERLIKRTGELKKYKIFFHVDGSFCSGRSFFIYLPSNRKNNITFASAHAQGPPPDGSVV